MKCINRVTALKILISVFSFLQFTSLLSALQMNSISDIAFKQVKDNFYLGAYADFNVILMKDCGYVNATKLCNDGGKRFRNWTRLDHTKDLIEALQNQITIEASGFTHDSTQCVARSPCLHTSAHIRAEVYKYVQTENILDDDRLISGTYCHPLLIPSIAGWISPIFQLKVNRIIYNFLVQ